MVDPQGSKAIVRTVFIALILDLLAFTVPLPLFPRLIAWYLHKESHSPDTNLLSRLLQLTHTWRSNLLSLTGRGTFGKSRQDIHRSWLSEQEEAGRNWDVVLLGGAMGSLFSLCQCIISPWLGRCELSLVP